MHFKYLFFVENKIIFIFKLSILITVSLPHFLPDSPYLPTIPTPPLHFLVIIKHLYLNKNMLNKGENCLLPSIP